MPALLALIPTKDWLYGGLIIFLIIFGIHEHHKILAEGIAEQKAADDKATAVLIAASAKQTAELQAKATMAEQAYDKEVNSLSSIPVPSVRLCVYPHISGSVVSQAGTAQSGTQSTGSAAGLVQPVPSGDSSGGVGTAGPDIGAMLSALAVAADRDSAALREFQSR
jgi:hypothetical protein